MRMAASSDVPVSIVRDSHLQEASRNNESHSLAHSCGATRPQQAGSHEGDASSPMEKAPWVPGMKFEPCSPEANGGPGTQLQTRYSWVANVGELKVQ